MAELAPSPGDWDGMKIGNTAVKIWIRLSASIQEGWQQPSTVGEIRLLIVPFGRRA
jgi:hypothetical protein